MINSLQNYSEVFVRELCYLRFTTIYEDRIPYVPHNVEDAHFVGEAILERSFNTGDPDIYKLVGLEQDDWQIVAIHTVPANAYHDDSYVVILAMDKNAAEKETVQPGGLVGERSIDVVKFTTSLKIEDILSTMKRSSIYFKHRGLQEADWSSPTEWCFCLSLKQAV